MQFQLCTRAVVNATFSTAWSQFTIGIWRKIYIISVDNLYISVSGRVWKVFLGIQILREKRCGRICCCVGSCNDLISWILVLLLLATWSLKQRSGNILSDEIHVWKNAVTLQHILKRLLIPWIRAHFKSVELSLFFGSLQSFLYLSFSWCLHHRANRRKFASRIEPIRGVLLLRCARRGECHL